MSTLSKTDVVVLAGGLGTRLQSVIKGRPKVLAKIKNHPFLEYLLNQLNNAQFKKIFLCTGYLSHQVEKSFGNKYKNLELYYSSEPHPLGTAGSIRNALPLLHSETILVMNGDSFCEVDFKKFWQFHTRKKSNASLALTLVSDTSRFGQVTLGPDDSIFEFKEKKTASGEGFINAGVYLINKSLIKEISQGKKISIERDIFPKWIGREFYGYKSSGKFIDIGTPESLVLAEEFFANHQL